MTIVLASNSASRKVMLKAAGVAFEAVPAQIDERAFEDRLGAAAPQQVALDLSKAKAAAVEILRPGRTVLGSDSLVTVAGQRFDKPPSRAVAAEHLRFFSGRTMELHSGAAIVRNERLVWHGARTAVLRVRELSSGFIERYLAAEWPAVSSCVGVFRIEGRGVQLFEEIEGDQFTVLGMPLLDVLSALRELGELDR